MSLPNIYTKQAEEILLKAKGEIPKRQTNNADTNID
jgi:hypothetical protein